MSIKLFKKCHRTLVDQLFFYKESLFLSHSATTVPTILHEENTSDIERGNWHVVI